MHCIDSLKPLLPHAHCLSYKHNGRPVCKYPLLSMHTQNQEREKRLAEFLTSRMVNITYTSAKPMPSN